MADDISFEDGMADGVSFEDAMADGISFEDSMADGVGVGFEDTDGNGRRRGHLHAGQRHGNPDGGGASRGEGGEVEGGGGDTYPRGVYRDVVREMLGLVHPGDVDRLGEDDTVLLRVFECGMIFGGVDNQGRERAWNWRGVLRDLLLVG